MEFLIRLAVTSLLVVAVAEVAKRSTLLGALVASLPLTSLLAMVWLYLDTHDTARVAALSAGIFWLVLPSLVLFVALPLLLRHGVGFWPGLGVSVALTVAAYAGLAAILARSGIDI
jgi:hypothetical protein